MKYFAALRERRGRDEEVLEIAEGLTLADLYDQLFPPDSSRPSVAYARNATMARATDPVEDGDEIVFLPPLGGG